MLSRPVLVASALGTLVLGCSSSNAAPGEDASGVFIAYTDTFSGFHNWSSAPASAIGDDAGDGLHGLGPLRVYWNQDPPHGATEFPVGTIIVKETEQTDVTERTVFAMVKRSATGSYNGSGAIGWQWYSLQDNADGSVNLLWSGLVSPPGETYANQTIGDCNGCHEGAKPNDYVWDTALDLSKF